MDILNTQQRIAAAGTGGAELVIAGAGSGKTKTLISKVTSILNCSGILPENMLILTFSRRAADEIKKRAEHQAGLSDSQISAGTFHSFAWRIIREYPDEFLKISGFTGRPDLLDENRKERFLINEIMSDLHRFKGIPSRAVYDIVSRNIPVPLRILKSPDPHNLNHQITEIKQRLLRYKAENNFIEYDDMLRFASAVIRNNSDIRIELQKKFRYILVDEYQDTSDDNFELLSLLLPQGPKNFFAVGDDWQSIYGFRNSNIDYILRFHKYFPAAVTHRLTVNYRSRKEIVKISNKFILKNKKRTRKKLVSFKGSGGLVKNYFCRDAVHEIEIIEKITGRDPAETIAVLYRNNRQGAFLEKNIRPSFRERLKFMTMHASKGLEFESVILAGISDSVIPDRSTDLEEERRLMYVGLTRAKERLYILSHTDEKEKPPRFYTELSL